MYLLADPVVAGQERYTAAEVAAETGIDDGVP